MGNARGVSLLVVLLAMPVAMTATGGAISVEGPVAHDIRPGQL